MRPARKYASVDVTLDQFNILRGEFAQARMSLTHDGPYFVVELKMGLDGRPVITVPDKAIVKLWDDAGNDGVTVYGKDPGQTARSDR